MKRKDQISGGVWLILSLIVIQQSLKMGVGNLRNAGAGMIPFICGIALAFLSVFTVINGWVEKEGTREEGKEEVGGREWAWLMIVVVALLIFTMAFQHVGFFWASFGLLVLLFRGFQKWWGSFLAAGVTVSLGYLLFHVILKIQFPMGPWAN